MRDEAGTMETCVRPEQRKRRSGGKNDRHDALRARGADAGGSSGEGIPDGRFAILIPVYNHAGGIGPVIERARRLGLPIRVVDDGSTDGTAERLEAIGGITVIRHDQNRGKGAALLTGFAALAGEADWAVTLDADGQHDPADVPSLIRAIPKGQRPIVIGRREGMVGADVPWTSRFGRKFSNFWVRCAGGPVLADTQSGMRIYPLPAAAGLGVQARRFQFEVEILVRARWAGIPVVEAPVGVCYTPGIKRISHFRPFVDFCRNSATFTRLILLRMMGTGTDFKSVPKKEARDGDRF